MSDYRPLPDPSDPEGRTWWINEAQRIFKVHLPTACTNRPCAMHHPSDHHMRSWPMEWVGGHRMLGGRLMRYCPHNQLHPDPDGIDPNDCPDCDGCCRPA